MNEKVKDQVKTTAQGGVKVYNDYSKGLTPFFTGIVGSGMGSDLGRAIQASGVDVNPANFKRAGAGLGFAAPFIPKSGRFTGPLMYSALGASVLNDGYKADRTLSEVLETLDPLGVNRNQDNVPFFDRIVQASTHPNVWGRGYQFLRDFSPFSGILNIPAVQDRVDDAASKVISTLSYPYFTAKGMNGYYYAPEGISSKLHQVPKYDWLLGTKQYDYKDGFIHSLNPLTWVESVPAWWDSLVGD